jgi:hypothetical protein
VFASVFWFIVCATRPVSRGIGRYNGRWVRAVALSNHWEATELTG